MFEYKTAPFGQFEYHILEHKMAGQRLTFVPSYGGCILDIQIDHTSIIDGYTTPVELDINRWGKSGLLFPFPNRLKDGQYKWNGKEYQFPINETTTGTALHGFGMDKPFTVLSVQTEEQQSRVALQFSYDGKLEAYPFPFNLQIDYILTLEEGLRVEYRCWNTGVESLPWGFGWHPYFRVSETIETSQLATPNMMMVGVNESMIPTGKKYLFSEFKTSKTIGPTILDNCFAFSDADTNLFKIYLSGENGVLTYWQKNIPFVQLFTPPDRKSIAIEPMTCNIDAFNNKEGLIALEPGDIAKGAFGVQFKT